MLTFWTKTKTIHTTKQATKRTPKITIKFFLVKYRLVEYQPVGPFFSFLCDLKTDQLIFKS